MVMGMCRSGAVAILPDIQLQQRGVGEQIGVIERPVDLSAGVRASPRSAPARLLLSRPLPRVALPNIPLVGPEVAR